MAKKSGSRSSRSERNAGRKRAERARQHGLPVRQGTPPRARAATPEPSDDSFGEARSSDAPLSSTKKPAGIPTLVKVVGGAFVILIAVYLLSRQRDDALLETKPAAEPAAAVSALPSAAADVGPELVPAAEPSAVAPERTAAPPAEAPAPVVSVTPPAKPVVAAPVVAEPSKPKAEKPAVPAPAAPKPVAAPAPVAAPTPAPKPPAPKAAPAAPPVDNPY
jgi:hypothetical protein